MIVAPFLFLSNHEFRFALHLDRMVSRVHRLTVLLVTALALAGVAGLGAQDELRQRQNEIAESELRYLAEKAKSEGRTSVTFTHGFRHELIPEVPQNRLRSATIVVARATGNSEAFFYQPPPTFWTVHSFAIEQEIAGKEPRGPCRHVMSTSQPANHLWVPMLGGSRNVSGVVIRHDARWPMLPVAGRRYLLIGERCSTEMMELTLGSWDIYEVLPGDRILANPADTDSDYVRYVNNLGTLSKLRELLETFR